MRKILVSLLLALACACTLAAFGCTKKHTVTFDANGGLVNGSASVEVEVEDGQTVESAGDAVKDGYVFDYWALDGKEYVFSTPVQSDVTLVASYTEAADCTVTYKTGAGVSVVSDVQSGSVVPYNTELRFTLDIGAFYEGDPVVKVNNTAIQPIEEGGLTYSAKITSDTTVQITGIYEAVSELYGTGTVGDPYLVYKPVDLLFLAERINAGDSSYTTAYYSLANDLDLKGETIDVIGDGSTDYSVFCGYFEGNGYVISNFKIDAVGVGYVGLFGCVSADANDSNGGTIYNLQIKDFEINATISGSAVFCGSLVGYGIGANLYLCDAINGEINVNADKSYFSYVGGLIGIQQSVYDSGGNRYLSAVAYSTADVDIYAASGSVLYAGGLVGYLLSEESMTTAYILNSYATGNVSGAMRSGGLVGCLGAYASVSHCYATGDVVSQSVLTSGEWVYAYAGGLVGYAENDTSVTDSFAAGGLAAVAVKSSNGITGEIIGYAAADGSSTVGSREAVVFRSYYAEGGKNGDYDFTSKRFQQETVGWQSYDWVIEEGAYPTINYAEDTKVVIRVTLDYGGKTVGGASSFVKGVSATHVPFSYWYYVGDVAEIVSADDGSRSYGYFFDEACTLKVPYSFVAVKDYTFYTGFADTEEIAGTYYLSCADGSERELVLLPDGTLRYSDGARSAEASYIYDGRRAVLHSVRLARYALVGEIDPAAYGYVDMIAVPAANGEGLVLYDGTFFTESAPLSATKNLGISGGYYVVSDGITEQYTFRHDRTGTYTGTDGSADFTYTIGNGALTVTLKDKTLTGSVTQTSVVLEGKTLLPFDEYKGVWLYSATVNKSYTFDGMGGWTYRYVKYANGNETAVETVSGTYVVGQDGVASLSNGATASFDGNGFLVIGNNKYGNVYAYKGVWTDGDVTVTLDGAANGTGTGMISFSNGSSYQIEYAADSVYEGYVTMYYGDTVVGLMTFDRNTQMASAKIYLDSAGGFGTLSLYRNDDYMGSWISESELFELIAFNGYGSYSDGKLTVGDTTVAYTLADSTLEGSFVYGNVHYTLSYDETTGTITVRQTDGNGETVTLERKDMFGDLALEDADGATYEFDGRGNLSSGGKITVTTAEGSTVYGYKMENGSAVLSLGGTECGRVYAENGAYVFSVNGRNAYLYTRTKFTGVWAVAESFDTVEIGLMDLNGNIAGTYFGEEVTFVYADTRTLTVTYGGATVYFFLLDDKNAAVSDYETLYPGYYALCARQDEFFGAWEMEGGATVEFDGLSDSGYTNGNAVISFGGGYINYYYTRDRKGGVMLWSADSESGSHFYKLVWCETDAKYAYVNGDKAFMLEAIDSLYLVSASDDNGVVYEFDGQGEITASNGNVYQYEIVNFVGATANLTLTDKNGNHYTAVLDYSDANDIKLTVEAV